MFNRFETKCGEACMRISTSKTEAMVVSRAPSQCTLHVSGVPLNQVERFKYLGFTFTSDGKTDTEIYSRIGKSSTILHELYRTIIAKKAQQCCETCRFQIGLCSVPHLWS